MKLVKFYQSLTFKLTAALAAVTYLISLIFFVGQLLFLDGKKQPQLELMTWFSQISPTLESIITTPTNTKDLQQQLLQEITLGKWPFEHDNQEYSMTLNGLALVTPDSMLLAQIGSFQFEQGDLGSQIPIRSRDDLSDRLLGRFNSGLERYDDKHLYIRSIQNTKSETVAAVIFDLSWPDGQFKNDTVTALGRAMFPDVLGHALLPLIFVLPCGFCIILLASRQLKSRLEHLYDTIAFWSRGELHHKIEMTSKDELGLSFARLNMMAAQLAQTIESQRQLQTLQQRNMLAAELHDTVKQQLFANNLTLATCKQLFDTDAEQAKGLLNQVAGQNKAAFEQINKLISTLHQPVSNTSLAADLLTIVSDWQNQNTLTVNTNIDENIEVSQSLKNTCTRALVEALQNIHKHSDASTVNIDLWMAEQTLHLNVQDNGSNAANVELGQGLDLLKSSVVHSGGVLLIKPNDNSGFMLKIELPVQPLTKDAS
jgi:NarL family two-component system sensor histidine kinase LiaS